MRLYKCTLGIVSYSHLTLLAQGAITVLNRFSVVVNGAELISYKPAGSEKELIDPDLFAGLMEALQILSQEMGAPIQALKIANNMLYVRTFGDFTIRLLVDQEMDAAELDPYFTALAKETISLLPELKSGRVLDQSAVEERFCPILAPLLEDAPITNPVQPDFEGAPLPKMAIIGLASAGKTTIKNMFLEKMPANLARNTNPTLGVEVSRKFYDFLSDKIFIADFGGQAHLRSQYFTQEYLWRDTSVLIFVVDIQSPDEFEEARQYLADVWDLLVRVNNRLPHLSILFHKYDEKKRKKLAKNLQKALSAFRDFVGSASFYLTTIEDSSSNLALIQSLYFSLPDVMIKRLLEQDFLVHFEQDILPRFSLLVPDPTKPLADNLKIEMRVSASLFGRTYGLSLQESWLKYLTGEYTPAQQSLNANMLFVTRQGPVLRIRISDYADQGYAPEMTKILLDGLLDGIAKTFHLVSPQIVEEKDSSITWQIGVEKPL
ncbi:MAG TPA: ADP-ribosylation factor-like protein [Candidatus Lokiarchaeia archaeon]|nr:ADP-ribosylation factor-like protein [Candidatus Lokiarchaeia archaeon]